ncbi:MAG: right-handed parallel beta-helix repeat-containing protein [Saprospiraceae bacterium]
MKPEQTKHCHTKLTDTIIIKTTQELRSQINSNRVIKLINHEYILATTLLIDQVKNLKIIGTSNTKLRIAGQNATVLSIVHSKNIHLDSLILGHRNSLGYQGEQGVLRVSHSNQISIANAKLLSAGTFGFVSNNVYDLSFTNSEITACTALLFELEKSHHIEFEKVKFHHNDLGISVLGAFTRSTKDIHFKHCSFFNNKPKMLGNPAFNFFDNYEDDDQTIIFSNCSFKNNKGYKWYGEKIVLKDCEIDSTDFIGLQWSNEVVLK